jgi:hypothetical protein
MLLVIAPLAVASAIAVSASLTQVLLALQAMTRK